MDLVLYIYYIAFYFSIYKVFVVFIMTCSAGYCSYRDGAKLSRTLLLYYIEVTNKTAYSPFAFN